MIGRAIIHADFALKSKIRNPKSKIPLHVVMISKALVIGAYHSKLKHLAAQPDVELTAIVPPSWRDERGERALSRTMR